MSVDFITKMNSFVEIGKVAPRHNLIHSTIFVSLSTFSTPLLVGRGTDKNFKLTYSH